MAFLKKLNKFSLGSQDSEGFFLQQLLHHKPLSKEGPNGILPSFSSIEAAEYRPFRRSTLIKELYDTAISALESIGPFKGKKSKYVGYEMERSASCLQTKISVREVDLGAIEDMLRSTNLDTLYAEVFRNLSEMVFLAYKLLGSVLDAKRLETNNKRRPPGFGWPLFTQDVRLEAALTHAMKLIRDNAPPLGFTADAHDPWIEEGKAEEDYSIIYDDSSPSRKSKAIQAAVRAYVEKWFDTMSELVDVLAKVKKGDLGAWTQGPPPSYEIHLEGKVTGPETSEWKGKEKS